MVVDFSTLLSWGAPESSMRAASAAGEILLARFRIFALCLIVLVPTFKLITGSDFSLAVLVSYVALSIAIFFYWYVQRFGYATWIGFSTQTFDVGLIVLALYLDVQARGPLAAVNNKGTFDLFFLTIAASALRFDPRISLYAGLFALASYLGFVMHAVGVGESINATVWVERYGIFYLPDQISRLLFLFMGTLLAFVFVSRSTGLLKMAVRDSLTGLFNRNFLHAHLQMELAAARRNKQELAVALVDIDHFKRINDQHGHPVGDEVLGRIAGILRRELRENDLIARYGGEEFCIVLPSAGPETARRVLERLRQRVAAEAIATPAGATLQVTLSAGVSRFPNDAGNTQALIAKADDRLLVAKAKGRNRVVSEG